MLQRFSHRSARRTHQAMTPHLRGDRLLDVGAAEGSLGAALAEDGYDVSLLDVVDLNRSPLPLQLYDGHTFPYGDDAFDTVILSLVLHHCRDPIRVLDEAIRATRQRLLICESVYRTLPGRWVLSAADHLFNGLRSGWHMPGAVHFKRARTWQQLFAAKGLALREQVDLSRGIHRQALFILDLNPPSPARP